MENIFAPFGMSSSGYVWNDQMERRAARPHDKSGVPSNSKKSTSQDVARYGSAGLAHPEGEIATTKAASAAKTLTTLATLSTTPIEEAMAAATVWFQLYVFRDRAISASLVERAEAAGCKAVVLTVDVPMLGKRERDVRNRFTLPDHLSLKNLLQAECQEFPKNGAAGSGLAAYIASLFDAALTWKDIEWLARVTKLPVVVKGILRADDALRAVNHGASGIIVPNHGARQLRTSLRTDLGPEFRHPHILILHKIISRRAVTR
jgi:4-hydroxymandelate oxidase